MSLFLEPAELAALTGYTRGAEQVRWLKAHGIEPFIAADGAVHVTRDVVEQAARVLSGLEARAATRRRRPNFGAVT